MKTRIPLIFLFLILILAACTPQGSDSSEAAPSIEDADHTPTKDTLAEMNAAATRIAEGSSQESVEAPSDTQEETQSGPIPVIIDTDMAVDDWGAILYTLKNEDADVLGISLVGNGEATCDPGVSNILRLVTLAEHAPVPVACANPRPMAGSNLFPQSWRDGVNYFNGERDAITPAENPIGETTNAVVMMKELLENADQPVTFLITGPTTNVAQLLQDYPEVKDKIKHMYVMGGAVETDGNVDPLYKAEWNFYIDPKADNILLQAGVPITLGSMDYTNLIPFNNALFEAMKAEQDTPAAQFLVRYEEANPWRTGSGVYLWDQATAVMMMNRDIVEYKNAPMCVVEEGNDQGDIISGENCPTHTYGIDVDSQEVFKEYWQTVNGN